MRNILRVSLLFVFSWVFVSAYADTVQNPTAFVQTIVTNLQNKVNGRQSALESHPQQLYAIVKTVIMPYVDIDEMAGLALGPKWRMATATQQQNFINSFSLLLTKTYADVLIKITDYNITVNPMRGIAWQTAPSVAVTGQVVSISNGQSSQITYYLHRSGDTWKIYDLAVEGVSFLKNYQAQFQSFSDMNTLIAKINQLNAQPVNTNDQAASN